MSSFDVQHPLGLVTVAQVCELLSISRPTFERLVRNQAQGFPRATVSYG